VPDPLPELPWDVARARVHEIRDELAGMRERTAWGQRDAGVGFVPTPEGLRSEALIREAGGLVSLEVQRRAAGELQAIDDEERVALDGRTKQEMVERLHAEAAVAMSAHQAALDEVERFMQLPAEERDVDQGVALVNRVRERGEALRVVGRRIRTLQEGEDEYALRRTAVIAAHTRAVLGEARPMGPAQGQRICWPVGNPRARSAVHEAAECFPTSWWRASEVGIPLCVDATPDRAGYSPVVSLQLENGGTQVVSLLQVSEGQPTLDRAPGYATAVHELSHRMEHVSRGRIPAAEQVFLWRRTTDLATGQRQPLEQYRQQVDEFVRPDGFADSYVGKDYGTPGGACEVLSTGIEATMGGAFGGLRGEGLAYSPDEDHRRFSIGCLVGL